MSDPKCPFCGNDELFEIQGSSNAFCGECCDVVEPTDDSDLSDSGRWACYNCSGDNSDDESDCHACGLSHDTSDHLWDNGEPGA